jgi:hypothetical protein
MSKQQSKEHVRGLLRANIGRVITSTQLRDAAGPNVREWAQHIRELREREQWPVLTNRDDPNLKRGEYFVSEAPPAIAVRFERGISADLGMRFLGLFGFTCQMCGAGPEDVDPSTGHPARLRLGRIKGSIPGTKEGLSNLRVSCRMCNQGAKQIENVDRPTAIYLLSQVRRGGLDEQLAVFRWLRKKFAHMELGAQAVSR